MEVGMGARTSFGKHGIVAGIEGAKVRVLWGS